MRTRIPALALLFLALLPAGAPAATHVVTALGQAFDPSEITIQIGDTVEWHWGSLLHTVTSGVDLSDPQAGALFDAPLDSGNPVFPYTFTEAGDQPYFCRFHIAVGMTGLIHVETTTSVPDESLPPDPPSFGVIKSLY